jgi:hypothetical protein
VGFGFQYQNGCALASYEPVPISVERAAGGFRGLVARGKCAHVPKSCHGQWCDCGLGSSGDDDIGCTTTDNFSRLAERVSAAGARCCDAHIWASRTENYRHLTRRRVGQHHRNHERANAFGTLVAQGVGFLTDCAHTTDARRDNRAHPVPICMRYLQARVLERFLGGCYGELHEAVHTTRILSTEKADSIEIPHLSREFGTMLAGVEMRDSVDGGYALDCLLPRAGHI